MQAETLAAPKQSAFRVQSIDLLRGAVMIIMALDHVRDYFHDAAFQFDPLDLEKTTPILFMTRWITHFCAPTFVFLAGTSAFLSGQRRSRKDLSLFLLKRGLWLILLEFTILNFGWGFNITFPSIAFIVIWALGVSMIVLAALVYLPLRWIFVIGVVLVAGHNLLDPIRVQGEDAAAIGWSLLHSPGLFNVGNRILFIGYPIIPWIGVMALGYCFGQLYSEEFTTEQRRRILLYIGGGAILLFILLRSGNFYGDSAHWKPQSTFLYSLLSFINTSKYPPSLLYLLMTLGPSMLFLAATEKAVNPFTKIIITYGRVPLFYYLIHIYVIHLVAMFAAEFSGFDWRDMVIVFWVNFEPKLKGYGFNLGVVYLVWILMVAALFPLCRWYDKYKSKNRHKAWLSYL